MAYVAPIKKSDKRAGILVALIFHVILLLIFLFVTMKQADPPFPKEEVVMIMNFSEAGSGSSGGSESKAEESSSENSESTSTSEEVVEETITQTEESPVHHSSHSSNNHSETTNENSNPTPIIGDGNPFSGNGGGEDGGDGHGTGDGGIGTGTGPGNVGGGGVGDGSSRKVQFSPNLDNLTEIPAQVAVKIKIDNTGNVIWAEAQTSNSYTNTVDKKILSIAEKKAKEFKYKPTSASTKYDMKIIKLNFTVN